MIIFCFYFFENRIWHFLWIATDVLIWMKYAIWPHFQGDMISTVITLSIGVDNHVQTM